MAGKIKYDIVRDGLTAHFDPANRLSVSNYLKYASTGYPKGSVLNVAKPTKQMVDNKQTSYYLSTIAGWPEYNSSNYGYFEFTSGSKAILNVTPVESSQPEFGDEFTVNIWVKTGTQIDKVYTIFVYNNNPDNGSLILVPFNDNYYNLVINTNPSIIPGGGPDTWNIANYPFQTGSWYNIGVAYKTNTDENYLYINGVSDRVSDAYITSSGNIVPLYIGNDFSYSYDDRTSSQISSISFYNRKLTESEMIQNYRALKYRFEGEIGLPYIDDFDNIIQY